MERFIVDKSGNHWKIIDLKRGHQHGVIARVNDGNVADQIAIYLNVCYPNKLTNSDLKFALESTIRHQVVRKAVTGAIKG